MTLSGRTMLIGCAIVLAIVAVRAAVGVATGVWW